MYDVSDMGLLLLNGKAIVHSEIETKLSKLRRIEYLYSGQTDVMIFVQHC